MSETTAPAAEGEEQPTDIVGKAQHEIDDALDIVEAFAAEKIKLLPAIAQPFVKGLVDKAFGTIRDIINIPDDIGGDAD